MKNFNNNNRRFDGERRERPPFPEEAKKYQAKAGVLIHCLKITVAGAFALLGGLWWCGHKTDEAIKNSKNNK